MCEKCTPKVIKSSIFTIIVMVALYLTFNNSGALFKRTVRESDTVRTVTEINVDSLFIDSLVVE